MDRLYESLKETEVHGRYLNMDMISPVLQKWSERYKVTEVGFSVLGEPIYCIELGTGPVRILMWSQMHGNEATTTKAVLDLIKYFTLAEDSAAGLLSECRIRILPMLNPDGARAYTRVNARGIDLNRDAQNRSQPESIALRKAYEQFKPDFCFNLHDQRTIFNVGERALPATLSFLAPALDEEGSVTAGREASMKLIAAINQKLQEYIPGQVGRYDDAFNLNCVGDSFQSLNTPTLLFEAGHFPGDYQREETRKYVFLSLFTAVDHIVKGSYRQFDIQQYHAIPENEKRFWDILVRNPRLFDQQWEPDISLGLQFKEILHKGTIRFEAQIEEAGKLLTKFGHCVYDCRREADLQKLRENTELTRLLNG